MRKPKSKIVITEEIEDNFDENRYLNLMKWSLAFLKFIYTMLIMLKYKEQLLWKYYGKYF
jgi:hypothetical protein